MLEEYIKMSIIGHVTKFEPIGLWFFYTYLRKGTAIYLENLLCEWQQMAEINLYNLPVKITRFCQHGFITGDT
jgi:hypothetical protein